MKHISLIIGASLLALSTTTNAATNLFDIFSKKTDIDYSWSANFTIGPKHDVIISHTPTRTCINYSICAGRSLNFGPGSVFNGIKMSSCGLHLRTQSSKEEFIESMRCAGVDPIEVFIK